MGNNEKSRTQKLAADIKESIDTFADRCEHEGACLTVREALDALDSCFRGIEDAAREMRAKAAGR